jgi:gliding motility-associated-like protein
VWSNGDTTPAITVNQSGKYYITASDSVCSMTDSVDIVIVNQTPEKTDTGICAQSSMVLQARIADKYVWNTNDSAQQIHINQTGTYTVTRSISQCILTDTFQVSNYPTPISTGIDTLICKGVDITLTAAAAQSYQWNTGATTQQITVNHSGVFSVVKSIPPCEGTETYHITTHDLPQILMVQDTTVCFDEVKQLLLDAGQFKNYLWKPTDETTRTIYSSTAQVYKLTVTDSNDCVNSKEFEVVEDCPYKLHVPNVFTPNGDGNNDEFLVKSLRVDAIHMCIYDRWGKRVFETNDMYESWDAKGYPDGVYTIMLTYHAMGKSHDYIGNVTVIR